MSFMCFPVSRRLRQKSLELKNHWELKSFHPSDQQNRRAQKLDQKTGSKRISKEDLQNPGQLWNNLTKGKIFHLFTATQLMPQSLWFYTCYTYPCPYTDRQSAEKDTSEKNKQTKTHAFTILDQCITKFNEPDFYFQ